MDDTKAPRWMGEAVSDAAPLTFQQALDIYLDFIRDDYSKWQRPIDDSAIAADINAKMDKEFREGLHTEMGRKYLAVRTGRKDEHGVYTSRSAHSFIDPEGNIWKPAGFKGPTKNFKRGNIYSPKSYAKSVRWSGI